jgi:transposase-like protein
MQAEILTGPERRRRWSAEEKARIVGETRTPGARVVDVARRHGVSRGLLYTWRRETCAAALPDLVPIVMEMGDGPGSLPIAGSPAREPARKSTAPVREPEGVIEISLAGAVRVMVRGRVDPKALQAVLTALRRA